MAELFKTKRDACETPKEFAICENDDAKPCGSKEPEHIVPDVCNGNEIEIELSEIMTENQSSENCEENANESLSNLEEPEEKPKQQGLEWYEYLLKFLCILMGLALVVIVCGMPFCERMRNLMEQDNYEPGSGMENVM